MLDVNISGNFYQQARYDSPARKILKPTAEPGVYEFDIDNSTLSTFQDCSRKAEFYCVNGRTKDNTVALNFGTAIHLGLEAYYEGKPEADQESVMMEYFSKNPPPASEIRNFQTACRVMEGYRNEYRYPPEKTMVIDGSPQLEIPFRVPMGEIDVDDRIPYPAKEVIIDSTSEEDQFYVKMIRVFWTGRIDRLCTMEGEAWLMDHKTTTMLGEQYWDQFHLSQQMVGYLWACKALGICDPVGLYLNVLAVPGARRKTIAFERKRFRYFDWHLAEWEQDVSQMVADFIANLARGHFPRNTNSCSGKYGRCPYFTVCNLPPHNRHAALEREYQPVTWSPLHER